MESYKRGSSYGSNKSVTQRHEHLDDNAKCNEPEEDDPKKKTFKKVLVRFADKSNMTGVAYINNATIIASKLIWSLLLLAAMVAMTLHLYILIDNYYRWPKTAKIELGFANLPFPEVTICNTNPIHKTRLEKFQGAQELKGLLQKLEPKYLVPEQFDDDLFKKEYYDDYNYENDDDQNTNTETDPSQGEDAIDIDLTIGGDTGGDTGDDTGGDTGGNIGSDIGDNICGDTGGNTCGDTGGGPGGDIGGETGVNAGDDAGDYTGGDTGGDDSGNPANDSAVDTDSGLPKKRKKRFTDEYGKFDLSEFDSEYEDLEEVDEDFRFEEFEYDQPKDNQTKVNNVFKRLFMALNKTDRAALGHNISDMLLSCSFNGRVCDESLFSLHQTSDYGNCWTLSSEKFTVLDSGPRGGLSIVLYLETTEYLYGLTQGYGINVQILQRGTYPDPYQEGILIPASMETDIGLKTVYHGVSVVTLVTSTTCLFFLIPASRNANPTLLSAKEGKPSLPFRKYFYVAAEKDALRLHQRGSPHQLGACYMEYSNTIDNFSSIHKEGFEIYIKRLGKPHGECEKGEAFQRMYHRKYTRRACQQMCRVVHVMNTCGCYDEETEALALDVRQDLHVCNAQNETRCLGDEKRKFDLKNITCFCDNPCTETVYSKSTSSRQWPNIQYAYVLLDGVCNHNVKVCKSIRGESETSAINNNFIKLNVYFEDLNYEEIAEEEDISQAQLLSDVGGAIGLWIGLSILSFCEIVQLLFEVIDLLMYKLRRPRQKRREKQQQQDIERSNNNRQSDQFTVKERGPDGIIYGRSGIPTRFSNGYRNSFIQLDEYTNGYQNKQ